MHSLHMGEFIHFHHKDDMAFHATIMIPSGSSKKYEFAPVTSSEESSTGEDDDDEGDMDDLREENEGTEEDDDDTNLDEEDGFTVTVPRNGGCDYVHQRLAVLCILSHAWKAYGLDSKRVAKLKPIWEGTDVDVQLKWKGSNGVEESYFANAKLYRDSDLVQEALPLKASTSSHAGENPAKSVVVHVQPGNTSKIQPKVTRSNDYQVIAQRLIMPITKINSLPPNDSPPAKISCQKLQGTFSPKVYKLLEKSRYDFSNPSGLGKLELELTGEKIHGLTKAQHRLRKQGYQVDQLKTGLGFALAKPVRIRVTKKEKCVNVQHISIESNGKEKKPSDDRVSVFDRLSTPIARPSVFERLGSSGRIPDVQDRLGASSIPQSVVFNRLGGGST
ncbi:hypothetical protein BUALT_Bualt09G0018500 [Buddleja alternifolia]|uniref:Uncharacterized protein n=1 Tax=Buddleja alternifolia TaxID=168488 RepID=A0AAV6X3N8_9LAMI|nr:hypothetical protein BUALT_Bualt09G0018500 [Buddleja alternifolia]